MTDDYPQERLLVDEVTAARLLSVSPRTLWQLAADGEVPVVRVRSAKRYSVADLQHWIAQSKAVQLNDPNK